MLSGGEPIEATAFSERLDLLQYGHPDIQIESLPSSADTRRYQPSATILPTRPARDYHGASIEPWWIASYSALKVAEAESSTRPQAPETAQQDVLAEVSTEQPDHPAPTGLDLTPSIHNFPRGAEPGTFLHGLLEWVADEGFAACAHATSELEGLIARRCQRRGWQAWIKPLAAWLPAFLGTPLRLPDGGYVALAALTDANAYRAELEFWFEARRVDTLALDRLVTAHTLDARPRPALLPDRLNGMLKGFVDLIVERCQHLAAVSQ